MQEVLSVIYKNLSKISLPVIFGVILLAILVSKGVIKTDDASGFLGIVVIVAICIISWACHARCPHCKTFTIRKVGERHLSTSGVYQQKCGDGHYHPHALPEPEMVLTSA